jgi:hypothetical protein
MSAHAAEKHNIKPLARILGMSENIYHILWRSALLKKYTTFLLFLAHLSQSYKLSLCNHNLFGCT